MSKIDQAKEILKTLGLPEAQQNEISALTLLALCGVKPKDNWESASKISLKVTKGIMAFIKKEYKRHMPLIHERHFEGKFYINLFRL